MWRFPIATTSLSSKISILSTLWGWWYVLWSGSALRGSHVRIVLSHDPVNRDSAMKPIWEICYVQDEMQCLDLRVKVLQLTHLIASSWEPRTRLLPVSNSSLHHNSGLMKLLWRWYQRCPCTYSLTKRSTPPEYPRSFDEKQQSRTAAWCSNLCFIVLSSTLYRVAD